MHHVNLPLLDSSQPEVSFLNRAQVNNLQVSLLSSNFKNWHGHGLLNYISCQLFNVNYPFGSIPTMNSVQESRSRHSAQWPMAAGSCNGIHSRLSCLCSLWEKFLAITDGAYSNRTLEEVALQYRTWDSFPAKK